MSGNATVGKELLGKAIAKIERAVTLVMLYPPAPAREPAAWTHVPSQPLDAITAFAVPNPNYPSQGSLDFSGPAAW